MARDLILFLGEMARKPRNTGAIMPSSRFLARAMIDGLQPGAGPVIELGPGTGSFTRAMLARGIAPKDLHLVEMNPAFCARLRRDFPGVNVHEMSAADLQDLPVRNAQAVVSGLPLLNFPVPLHDAILRAALTCLAPGAPFVQFTYGPNVPLADSVRADLGLRTERGRKAWLNIPPARVYRFFKDGAQTGAAAVEATELAD